MRGTPEAFDEAVVLLKIGDGGKKAAIVAELEQIANNLAQDIARAGRLKVLRDELDNIEKTAGRLAMVLGDYDKHLVDIFSITIGAESIELTRGATKMADPCPADWAIEYEHRTQLRALAKRAHTIGLAMVGKYGADKGGDSLRKQLFGAPKSTFVWQLVRVWAERFGPDALKTSPQGPLFQFVELLSEWATGLQPRGMADDIKRAARTVPGWLQQQDPLYWKKQGQLHAAQSRGSTPLK